MLIALLCYFLKGRLILLFLYNFVNQPVNSSIVCFVAPEKICQL